MSVEFEQSLDRAGTHAVKLDARQAVFGTPDVMPLWVADMDFPVPEAVTRALVERAQHPVYGYSMFPDSLYAALIDWFQTRHHWHVDREWVVLAPGVVPSIHAACLAYAEPGDGVIVQPPVYPPFFSAVRKTGRRVIENPLIYRNGQYRMDLDHLEQCARDGARLLLLCSPHNPVGRVWSPAELDDLLAIARRYGLLVLSDEIHADLVFPDQVPHTVLATRAGGDDRVITAVAPSKSFNVPGLGLSAMIVPDPNRRKALVQVFEQWHANQCNPFSATGFEAAFRHGGPWLDALLVYLQGNRDRVLARLREMPSIQPVIPQGTYLMWLDCQALRLSDPDLRRFFIDRAGLGLNPGSSFGTGGQGFMRLNLASPRPVLMTALDRLQTALTEFRN